MNKMEIMRQKSVDILLKEMIRSEPGVDSAKLWKTAKTWDSNLSAHEFDSELAKLHGDFRVTSKRWYPRGHK